MKSSSLLRPSGCLRLKLYKITKDTPLPLPYQASKHRVKSEKITLGERLESEKRPLLRKRYIGRCKTYWKTSLQPEHKETLKIF